MSDKYFFGWTNFKWGFKEVVKIYSNKPSVLSKKRIESGVAFVIAQWGLIHWLVLNVNGATVTDICMWSGIEFAICGYVVNKIEASKIVPKKED